MVAVNDTQGLINYVITHAEGYALDPLAVLAISAHEGAFSAFGSNGVGDGGNSYGPWQLNTAGKDYAAFLGVPQNAHLYSSSAQAKAWSDEGINYVLQRMSNTGAAGKVNGAAIEDIVHKFEISADQPGEIDRSNTSYQQMLSGIFQGFKIFNTGSSPGPVTPPLPGPGGGGSGGGSGGGGSGGGSGGGVGGELVAGFLGEVSGPMILMLGFTFIAIGFLMWKGSDVVTLINKTERGAGTLAKVVP